LAVGYAALLLGSLPGRPGVVWLLPLAWLVLTVARVRFAPLFAVTAVIAIGDMLPHSVFGRRLLGGQWSPAGHATPVRRRWLALPLAVVATALTIQMAGLRVPVIGRGWVRFDEARWPLALRPDLKAIAASGSAAGVPIFNDMQFGGFLIYHEPHLQVFIDDRCPLYGTEFLRAYVRAWREDPAQIERWQRQYGFRYALVESGKTAETGKTGGRFDAYLSTAPGWSLVGRCDAAALYEHR